LSEAERTDWREVLFLPDGVFIVRYHKLSVKALKSLRSRLLTQDMQLRNEIGRLRRQIQEKKAKLKEIERMLNKLTDEKIKEIIERERQRKREAEEKASEFLKDYIGEEAFSKLQQKGYFEFKGADGKRYRITKDARLLDYYNGRWYHLCVIHPKDLPLPDIIASVFTVVKNDPNFRKTSRRLREVR